MQDEETFKEKFKRKFNESPGVPIAAGMTVAALIGGLYAFNTGNSNLQKTMAKYRVLFQGATIGILYYTVILPRQRAAEEKNA